MALEYDYIHWEEDGNGDLMPLEAPRAINYPAESEVEAGVVFGALNEYLGTLTAVGIQLGIFKNGIWE